MISQGWWYCPRITAVWMLGQDHQFQTALVYMVRCSVKKQEGERLSWRNNTKSKQETATAKHILTKTPQVETSKHNYSH